MKNIAILGATGSIGKSTLDVIARHPERYRVFALTANQQVDKLYQQVLQFHPEYAVMCDEDAAEQLALKLKAVGNTTTVLSGPSGLTRVAQLPEVDIVMAAIVGAVGLTSTFAAVRAGKRVLLANKEALVMAGSMMLAEAEHSGAQLIPVDSEHNAIYQCLPHDFRIGQTPSHVASLTLTASGGPFCNWDLEKLAHVTPEQACQHPTWSMGTKISIDSATMMNKALEVIEAYWLFAIEPENIHVVLHPQSIIHSLVSYRDGSLLAQLGSPDMRIPIASALAWPDRMASGVEPLDVTALTNLEFKPLCKQRFPCLQLSYDVLKMGGTAPTALNAANEVAVEAFVQGDILFTEIIQVITQVLEHISVQPVTDIETVLHADSLARELANEAVTSEVVTTC